jgi:threonine dehydrogenase-like Zn-dependent dehydrogenase
MIEFLAIGAHAVRRARIKPGQSVLVVGAGPIGIAAALFAKLRAGSSRRWTAARIAWTSAASIWARTMSWR